MKGKNRRMKALLPLVLLMVLIPLLFPMPVAASTSDQVILSFDPQSRRPPNRPINVYPPDGAKNIPLSIILQVSVSDPDNNALDVYFYNADGDILLGIDSVANNSIASCAWNGLTQGKTHRWYAVANDSEFENTSDQWIFTTIMVDPPPSGPQQPSPPPSPPPNQEPVANITGPNIGYVTETIIFSSHYSYDPDGEITGCRWDFENDGLFDTDWTEDMLVAHSFFTHGNYTVKLQVRDDDNATALAYHRITIKQIEPGLQLPIVNINGPYWGYTNENITFNSIGTYDPDKKIINYTWDFGDGNKSYVKNPVHKYAEQGNYIIFLTVVDNDNLTNSAIASVFIRDREIIKSKEIDLSLFLLLAIIIIILVTILLYNRHKIRHIGEKLDVLKRAKESKKIFDFSTDQLKDDYDKLISSPSQYMEIASKAIEKLEFKDRMIPELKALLKDDMIPNDEVYGLFVERDDKIVKNMEEAVILGETLKNCLKILERELIILDDELAELNKKIPEDVHERRKSKELMDHRIKTELVKRDIKKYKELMRRLNSTSFDILNGNNFSK